MYLFCDLIPTPVKGKREIVLLPRKHYDDPNPMRHRNLFGPNKVYYTGIYRVPDKIANSSTPTRMLKNGKARIYKCPACEFICLQSVPFMQHLQKNHPEQFQKYCCDRCNFACYNSRKLRAHKQTHTRGVTDQAEMNLAGAEGNQAEAQVDQPAVDSLPIESALPQPEDQPMGETEA